MRGVRAAILYKPLHNPILNARALSMRETTGMELLSTRLGDRELWRRLNKTIREGRPVGFLMDQDAGRRGVFVSFFAFKPRVFTTTA